MYRKGSSCRTILLPSQKVTDLETKAQLVVPKEVWRKFLSKRAIDRTPIKLEKEGLGGSP